VFALIFILLYLNDIDNYLSTFKEIATGSGLALSLDTSFWSKLV
jgi:hypothetical protein